MEKISNANELAAAIQMLDRIQATLEEMQRMARRAADGECSTHERELLQRDLEFLRERIDYIAAHYQRGDGGAAPR